MKDEQKYLSQEIICRVDSSVYLPFLPFYMHFAHGFGTAMQQTYLNFLRSFSPSSLWLTGPPSIVRDPNFLDSSWSALSGRYTFLGWTPRVQRKENTWDKPDTHSFTLACGLEEFTYKDSWGQVVASNTTWRLCIAQCVMVMRTDSKAKDFYDSLAGWLLWPVSSTVKWG